jgi:hypothetical protein
MDVWMDGCVDGWMHGWMDAWMNANMMHLLLLVIASYCALALPLSLPVEFLPVLQDSNLHSLYFAIFRITFIKYLLCIIMREVFFFCLWGFF